MMLEDRFFLQEWVQNLSNEDFRMLIYLFAMSSRKTGIVELNMRMLNFNANTGKQYTKADVLERFGNMICMIPGKENTAIFPDYIATNWAKSGKPIDVVRNPLFKSVVQELASNGMTIADVNALAKKQIVVKGDEDVCVECDSEDREDDVVNDVKPQTTSPKITRHDLEIMFQSFWEKYPKQCPRKTDKKKCFAKFTSYMLKSKDSVKLFNDIMNGLAKWMQCDTWVKDNGQYIMAPVRWLNNENWNDEPMKGNGNGSAKTKSANANYKSSTAEGIF